VKPINKLTKGALLAAFLFIIATLAYTLIPSDYEKITNHVFDFISLVVVVTVLATAVKYNGKKSRQLNWIFIFLALLSWLVADLIWTFYIYMGKDPFPSLSDIFYVIGNILLFVAVFRKYLNVRKVASLRDNLNALFVFIVLLLVVSFTVLLPIIRSDSPLLDKFLLVFYPVSGMVTIFFAVILISAFGAGKERLAWFFVFAGVCVWTMANTLFAYYDWNGIYTLAYNLVNLVYLAGLLFIGMGAYIRLLALEGVDKS